MNKPRVKLDNSGGMTLISNDGMQNVFSGLNTSSDPRTHNQYNFSKVVNQAELDALYRDGGIAAKIVDIPAEDATREWRKFNHEKNDIIEAAEKEFQVQQMFREAITYGRLYGGAAILMLTGQNLSKPLDVTKIKKGDLKNLMVFDRWELAAQDVNVTNPLSKNFMLPEYYSLYGGSAIKIHHSHFVRFEGIRLTRRVKSLEGYWGDSVLRRALEGLYDFMASKGGIASLVQKANQDVISKEGMFNDLASGEDEAIIKRYRMFKMMMSNINLALLDKNEEFARHTISFAGLADTLKEMRVWISGEVDIPQTRLFGVSSGGLNATGEGDLNNYYDSVKSKQDGDYRTAIEQLDQVLIRSALGEYPDDIEFEWNPLYQESGLEMAQQDLARSQVESTYLEKKIIKPSHVMKRLKAENTYQITDEEIKAQEKIEAEEQKVRENGGFDPEGGELPDLTEGFGGRDPEQQEEKDETV
ncbi:coil containing protein [Vibrio phage vB_VpP_1]|nr:coil containing protein [Vibrio phage vB_VpP_1]